MGEKDAKESKAVAPAAPAAAAEPEMPNISSALGRQFVILPAMYFSRKVNWEEPTAQNSLLMVFGAVVLIGLVMVQYTLSLITKAGDQGRMADPGDGATYTTKDESDGTVAVQEYDSAKVKELKMQFMMSVGMVTFLHIQWGYTQPLLMICLMQPMQFWGMQAFHVYVRGLKAEGAYARPWKKSDADNPLAKWAENKKKEAAELQEAKKKKDGKKKA